MSLLKVQNLGKAFRSYNSEWRRFARWFGLPTKHSEEHWVLRHVNFEIYPGEAIGIIGQNGAGKSTLLKMITGTLHPTEGNVQVNGRISAILELGMGFDPELTGRQNVFHAAGLMGFSVKEIKQIISKIESFADIGDYFDQSVRIYSSGMQARVAFAVATAFRPEILIVDEALSVGDAAFQRKCFRKIEAFQSEGTSILLVSHDVETIKKSCDKALFISAGKVVGFGDVKVVCDEYERALFGAKKLKIPDKEVSSGGYDKSLTPECEISYGNNKAQIITCWIQGEDEEKVNVVETRSQLVWCFNVTFNVDIFQPYYNMQIKTSEGVVLFGVNSEFLGYKSELIAAGSTVKVRFSFVNHLAPGIYFLNCGVKELNHANDEEFLHRRVDSAILKVVANDSSSISRGLVDLGAKFSVVLYDESAIAVKN